MSMQLFSAKLLEKEIKKIEELGLDGDFKLLHNIYTRELDVINKIKIDVIDTLGGIDAFEEKLQRQSIYFITPEEYQSMKERAEKYNAIKKIMEK